MSPSLPLLAIAGVIGRRRNAVLLLAGLLSAAAFPPVGAWPFLILGLALLFLMLDAAPRPRRAFADGWWFSWGLGIAGMYWTAISMTVDLAKFWWMMPFAVFGLTAVLALYAGLAMQLAWRLPLRGLARASAFALTWVGGEALRGTVPYGFPWNLVGNAWSGTDITLQPAALLGAYGLSLWLCMAAALLAWPHLTPPRHLTWRRLRGREGTALCVLMLALPLAWGSLRLIDAPRADTPLMAQPDIQLRLVQPAIPQSLKWDPRAAVHTVESYLTLSGMGNIIPVTHVIWPEAALPFRLADSRSLRDDLARIVPEGGVLLTGSVRLADHRPYNALEALDRDSTLTSLYDKIHLVPFGEFVPLRHWLPIDKITPGEVDFAHGKKHGPQSIAGLPPFAPLICYEVIFPGYARAQANGAQWILNITNDAWFGNSSGPYQHFGMARMRAVELGLPLVRVANNGISAIIDPYGRVLDRLPLNATAVLDHALPKPLPQPTLVARYGYGPALLLAALIALFGIALPIWRMRRWAK